MKKAHKTLIAGGIVASITATIGTMIGTVLLDKNSTVRKALGSKFAGDEDDDMGAEGDDPIINVAKTL